jgi:hypothetical protein
MQFSSTVQVAAEAEGAAGAGAANRAHGAMVAEDVQHQQQQHQQWQAQQQPAEQLQQEEMQCATVLLEFRQESWPKTVSSSSSCYPLSHSINCLGPRQYKLKQP